MKCKHCGKPEAEHHAFEALTAPEGCVCAIGTWHEPPGPVCEAFQLGPAAYCRPGYCWNCAHDKACHAGAQEGK